MPTCLRCASVLTLIACVGAGSGTGARVSQAGTASSGSQIELVLATAAAPGLDTSALQLRRDIERAYRTRAFVPIWTTADGRISAAGDEALQLLERAHTDGLDPGDYAVPAVAGVTGTLSTANSLNAAAHLDVALTWNVVRFLRDVHVGRVPPQAVGYHLSAPDDHDYAAAVFEAASARRLPELLTSFTPVLPQYSALKSELARYRTLASNPDATNWLGPNITLRPGDPLPDHVTLWRFLRAVGDVRADTPVPGGRYDAPLTDAVTRFQRRHGLEPDGVIGAATRTALSIPLRDRVRQIELAMERLRWLPHLGGRTIFVNIPTFRLWAVDAEEDPTTAALEMGVVVGKAPVTKTPIFEAMMTHVIFRPYWNVPRSILRNELLPAIRRDPAYLATHNYEIVRGDHDDSPVVAASPDTIAALAAGSLRLRQRPGPANALGLVKFVFPNPFDVYMHATPATALFARPRRDFSHGCVRLERPVDLASWVLADTEGWSAAAIAAAMHGEDSRRVDLRYPIRVLLFYVTALAAPATGEAFFATDLYGHDARLARALSTRVRAAPR